METSLHFVFSDKLLPLWCSPFVLPQHHGRFHHQAHTNYRMLIWAIGWPSPGVHRWNPLIKTQHVPSLRRHASSPFQSRELYKEWYESNGGHGDVAQEHLMLFREEQCSVCFDSVQATAAAQGSEIAHHHSFVSNHSLDLTHTYTHFLFVMRL